MTARVTLAIEDDPEPEPSRTLKAAELLANLRNMEQALLANEADALQTWDWEATLAIVLAQRVLCPRCIDRPIPRIQRGTRLSLIQAITELVVRCVFRGHR